MQYNQSCKILNCTFNNVRKDSFLESFSDGVFFNPNVFSLMRLQKDEDFYHIIKSFEYTINDSKVLWHTSRLLKKSLNDTISGSDFLPAFCNYHRSDPRITVYLLGAAPGVAAKAAERINKMSGRRMVVGEYSPPYGFEHDRSECDNIIDKVCSSGATVLILGLGTPKQEKWLYEHRHKMNDIKIFMCIGAAINYAADPSMRAPLWMRHLSIEWLFRLLQEPKRLWRRYLIECLPFFYLILLQIFGLYKDPFDNNSYLQNKGIGRKKILENSN